MSYPHTFGDDEIVSVGYKVVFTREQLEKLGAEACAISGKECAYSMPRDGEVFMTYCYNQYCTGMEHQMHASQLVMHQWVMRQRELSERNGGFVDGFVRRIWAHKKVIVVGVDCPGQDFIGILSNESNASPSTIRKQYDIRTCGFQPKLIERIRVRMIPYEDTGSMIRLRQHRRR
jgi:hypothetical protein